MQSLSRGWSFLQQAWKMAFADTDLIKPSIYTVIAGFFISVIGIVPMALAALIFGVDSLFGRVVLGVLGAGLMFVHYAVSYIFSGMTIYLIYGYLSEGDGRMDKAWAIIQREWLNILSLAAASTLVAIVRNWIRGNSRNRSFLRESIAGLINTVWTEATFLVLPAMVIDDLNLKDGLKRATFITKNNLLLIGLSTVGVSWITGAINFVLGLMGVVIGVGIALPFFSLGANTILLIIGVGLGVVAASVFFIVANVVSSYTATAYHTCLYLWARDVERAQQGQPMGIPVSVPAPAPLAAVLGN